jgi:hypothetical protein
MTRLPLLLLALLLAAGCTAAPSGEPGASASPKPRTWSQDLGAYALPAGWDASSGAAAFRTADGEGGPVDEWMFVPDLERLSAPTVFTYVELDMAPLDLCRSAAGTVAARVVPVAGSARTEQFTITPSPATIFGQRADGVRLAGASGQGAIYCAVLETRVLVYQAFGGAGVPAGRLAVPAALSLATPVLVPVR